MSDFDLARVADPGFTGAGVYHLRQSGRALPPEPPTADTLTDPTETTIAQTLYRMLPVGLAWRSPDGESFDDNSRLGGFLRALSGALAETYRRLDVITRESTAATMTDSLADWEAELGLPDPCVAVDPDEAARVAAVLARVRWSGVITPSDYIALAAELGYQIEIEEPQPFECGTSECGGDHEIAGGAAVEFYWIVRIAGQIIRYFEAGIGETGITPLTDFDRAGDLECLFRRLKPAWTETVFNYS